MTRARPPQIASDHRRRLNDGLAAQYDVLRAANGALTRNFVARVCFDKLYGL